MTASIGQRIKQLRKSHNVTQAELASKVDVSAQLISKYEKDERYPKIDKLEKLSDFFDVSIDFLTGLSNDPTPPEKRNPSLERIPPATGLDFNDGSPSYVATPKISYKQLLSSISALTAMNPGFTDELTKWELNEKLNACNEKEATALIQKIQRLLLDEFDM